MADMVVYEPPLQHRCGPNKSGYWLEHWSDPEGTVRVCTCGQAWVAYRRPQPEYRRYYMGVYWRRESRFARWRRERRARREAEQRKCICDSPPTNVIYDPVGGSPTRCGRCRGRVAL